MTAKDDPLSAFGRLAVAGRSLFACSANLRHHRIAIFVAVAMERLLAGAEGGNPSMDLIAQVAVADRRGTSRKDVRAPFRRGRLERCNLRKARFKRSIGFRCLSGHRLHKRHRLRNQKIAFLLPRHGAAPQAVAESFQQNAHEQSSEAIWKSTCKIVPSTGIVVTAVSGFSNDPRGLVAPVAIAQQPLVELAGR